MVWVVVVVLLLLLLLPLLPPPHAAKNANAGKIANAKNIRRSLIGFPRCELLSAACRGHRPCQQRPARVHSVPPPIQAARSSAACVPSDFCSVTSRLERIAQNNSPESAACRDATVLARPRQILFLLMRPLKRRILELQCRWRLEFRAWYMLRRRLYVDSLAYAAGQPGPKHCLHPEPPMRAVRRTQPLRRHRSPAAAT